MDPAPEPGSSWGTVGRYCMISGIAFTRTIIKASRIAGQTALFVWYVSTDPDVRTNIRHVVFGDRPVRPLPRPQRRTPVRNYHTAAENAYKRIRRNIPGAYHMTPEPEESEPEDERRRKLPSKTRSPSPDIQGAADIFCGTPPASPTLPPHSLTLPQFNATSTQAEQEAKLVYDSPIPDSPIYQPIKPRPVGLFDRFKVPQTAPTLCPPLSISSRPLRSTVTQPLPRPRFSFFNIPNRDRPGSSGARKSSVGQSYAPKLLSIRPVRPSVLSASVLDKYLPTSRVSKPGSQSPPRPKIFNKASFFRQAALRSNVDEVLISPKTPPGANKPTVFRVPDPTPSTGSTHTETPASDAEKYPTPPTGSGHTKTPASHAKKCNHECKHCGCRVPHSKTKVPDSPLAYSPLAYRSAKSHIATPYKRSRLSYVNDHDEPDDEDSEPELSPFNHGLAKRKGSTTPSPRGESQANLDSQNNHRAPLAAAPTKHNITNANFEDVKQRTGIVSSEGNAGIAHDDQSGHPARINPPALHSASSSQDRKSILKRRDSSASFGIEFTEWEAGEKPTISLDEEHIEEQLIPNPGEVVDMGDLPDAPETRQERVTFQKRYLFGLTQPRPRYYVDGEPIDYPVDRPSDEELFTKMQEHTVIDSPEKSELEDSVMKLAPSDETPIKKTFPYPATLLGLITHMETSEGEEGRQKKSVKRALCKIKGPLTAEKLAEAKAEAERFEKKRILVEKLEREAIQKQREEEIEQERLDDDYAEKFWSHEALEKQLALDEEARSKAEMTDEFLAKSVETMKEEIAEGNQADKIAKERGIAKSTVQELDKDTKRELDRLLDDFDALNHNRDTSFREKKVRENSLVTYRELETIFGKVGWLNDEVVNEFIGSAIALSLKNEGYQKSPTSGAPPVHAFNSAMWNTYQSKGPEGVTRWFKRAKLGGKNLLDARSVFIPINTGGHWVLLVIFGQDRQFTILDSMAGIPPKTKPQYTEFAHALLRYELGNDYDKTEWHHAPVHSSQQLNGTDCGVFVCLNALALVRGLDPAKSILGGHGEMQKGRRMIAGVLVRGSLEAAGVGF